MEKGEFFLTFVKEKPVEAWFTGTCITETLSDWLIDDIDLILKRSDLMPGDYRAFENKGCTFLYFEERDPEKQVSVTAGPVEENRNQNEAQGGQKGKT